MKHLLLKEEPTYKIALLIKESSLNKQEIIKNYSYLDQTIVFSLEYNEQGKCPASLIKSYLNKLLKGLGSLSVDTLYVCDSSYFKTLTKSTKSDPHYGYVLPCKIKGYEHMDVILGVNYQALIYNPTLLSKLQLSQATLKNHVQGIALPLGASVGHSVQYPAYREIPDAIDKLAQHDALTVDIETYSLKFHEAGIASIAFAWNEEEAISFVVDKNIKILLREFFTTYKGTCIYHNANFDLRVLVYELWMHNLLDTKGMLTGLDIMTRNIEDTKLIAYLATNTTVGNELGLKKLAHEFAGNYAEDSISNIKAIPVNQLLKYNAIDCLSTWYVYNKYRPTLLRDDLLDIYWKLLIPSVKVIIQTELTGMAMSQHNIAQAKEELLTYQDKYEQILIKSESIKEFNNILRQNACIKANDKLKVKVKPLSDFDHIAYNPNSNKQTAELLYTCFGLDVVDTTDTGLPSTSADTLTKLLNQKSNYNHIIEALIGLAEVSKILSTFIPAFENGIEKEDGSSYLHGNFNLGGTVSGRMSSNNPNLMQIPSSGTKYAKTIKRCFRAPDGWVMVGADFNSLEDRISALITKDPNKLKVYTDGYDGHCLRAYYYFKDQMPDIVETVESINSIKHKYPDLRQLSKTPTFLLTYGGTHYGLIKQLGLEPEEALKIEENYHQLYQVSDEWVESKIEQASVDGYVTIAFGLRLRTPILQQVLLGKKSTPYKARSEARTAGNALGQSYGLLNNRACNEFMQRVWDSEHRESVKPIAQIHDASYYLIKDDINVLDWVNRNLIQCMEWQELPEIYHETVKLGGELEVYYPDWSNPITIPNNASKQEILRLCKP